MKTDTPISCSLTGQELPARLAEMRAIGHDALLSLGPGAVARFHAEERTHARLERIIASESRCCPFLAFDLREREGALVLTVTAPADAEPLAHDLVAAFAAEGTGVRVERNTPASNVAQEETTMQGRRKIAVAGATGRAGRHVVDILEREGHDVVPISRSGGVDVVSGDGLADALAGVESVVDVATGASPEREAATEFFTTAARNLHQAGERSGVQRMLVASIIGADRFSGGYGAAKVAHEKAMLAGPIPVHVLRAAQFHEFVEQLVQWGTQGDVSYVPRMRTQLVAARTVAEALAELALDGAPGISEIAGPREENIVEMATLLAARQGDSVRIEGVSDPTDGHVYESDALLPGPDATLAGPTFEEWLESTFTPAGGVRPARAGGS
jgi:uncharacterized protein YbjT (DUF2867 family)